MVTDILVKSIYPSTITLLSDFIISIEYGDNVMYYISHLIMADKNTATQYFSRTKKLEVLFLFFNNSYLTRGWECISISPGLICNNKVVKWCLLTANQNGKAIWYTQMKKESPTITRGESDKKYWEQQVILEGHRDMEHDMEENIVRSRSADGNRSVLIRTEEHQSWAGKHLNDWCRVCNEIHKFKIQTGEHWLQFRITHLSRELLKGGGGYQAVLKLSNW